MIKEIRNKIIKFIYYFIILEGGNVSKLKYINFIAAQDFVKNMCVAEFHITSKEAIKDFVEIAFNFIPMNCRIRDIPDEGMRSKILSVANFYHYYYESSDKYDEKSFNQLVYCKDETTARKELIERWSLTSSSLSDTYLEMCINDMLNVIPTRFKSFYVSKDNVGIVIGFLQYIDAEVTPIINNIIHNSVGVIENKSSTLSRQLPFATVEEAYAFIRDFCVLSRSAKTVEKKAEDVVDLIAPSTRKDWTPFDMQNNVIIIAANYLLLKMQDL